MLLDIVFCSFLFLTFDLCVLPQILEPCQNSLAYKPPNPWTMGILSLLAEIYNLPSLKMNLKFDIEVPFFFILCDSILYDTLPFILGFILQCCIIIGL